MRMEIDIVQHDLDDYGVKSLMAELNVSEGWDDIPEGFGGASILAYRGDTVWHFRRRVNGTLGSPEYSVIEFPGIRKLPNYQFFIVDYMKHQKGIRRVPDFTYLN